MFSQFTCNVWGVKSFNPFVHLWCMCVCSFCKQKYKDIPHDLWILKDINHRPWKLPEILIKRLPIIILVVSYPYLSGFSLRHCWFSHYKWHIMVTKSYGYYSRLWYLLRVRRIDQVNTGCWVIGNPRRLLKCVELIGIHLPFHTSFETDYFCLACYN